MKESVFQAKVIKWLKEHHIWHVKIWGGGFQKAGIPDILICCGGVFVAAELKKEDGILSALQIRNLRLIQASGGLSYELKPSNFEEFKNKLLEIKGEI